MKRLASIILAGLMLVSVLVSGCKVTNDGQNGKVFLPKAYALADDSGQSQTGYTADGKPYATMVEGVHYSNEIGVYDKTTNNETTEVYNKDVFYRNNNWFECADPAVFRCEDETDLENYGKFFLYGTTGVGIFNCYVSDDLVSWRPKYPAYKYGEGGWEGKESWAPEVIWDKNADREAVGLDPDAKGTGVYYLFYTAGPSTKYYYMANTGRDLDLGLAVSTSPYGPFIAWNGVEKGATIGGVNYAEAQNYQKYTTYQNKDLADVPEHGRRNGEVTNNDIWFNIPAMRASSSFQFANKDKAGYWVDPDGNIVPENTVGATYIPEQAKYMDFDDGLGNAVLLDSHPFIDPVTGDYYMYFSRSAQDTVTPSFFDKYGSVFNFQSIYVVKMIDNDWGQVDYSSVTRVMRPRLNFINDLACEGYYQDALNFDNSQYKIKIDETKGATENPWTCGFSNSDEDSININEGPYVMYNEDCGLYYMMLSSGTYSHNAYAVNLCVAYSPLGPFRKLSKEEGGLALTVDNGSTTDVMRGVGHHSMITLGDELVMCYHHQINPNGNVHDRAPTIDRVVWTVNDNGLPVMYTNGPTNSVQPIIYGTGATKYDIISTDATLTAPNATGINSLSYLTDGVIPVHINDTISPFAKEFSFSDNEITLVFNFSEYRKIVSVMVYQSVDWYYTFNDIKRIEMDAKIDGIEGVLIINNLEYNWDLGMQANGEFMRAGSNAVAVFEEIDCKEVRITIAKPYNDFDVHIPEIYILGVPKNA